MAGGAPKFKDSVKIYKPTTFFVSNTVCQTVGDKLITFNSLIHSDILVNIHRSLSRHL